MNKINFAHLVPIDQGKLTFAREETNRDRRQETEKC